MIAIRKETDAIEEGEMAKENNMLVNVPHTAADSLIYTQSRKQAALPLP